MDNRPIAFVADGRNVFRFRPEYSFVEGDRASRIVHDDKRRNGGVTDRLPVVGVFPCHAGIISLIRQGDSSRLFVWFQPAVAGSATARPVCRRHRVCCRFIIGTRVPDVL
jgi:hypothetical protein